MGRMTTAATIFHTLISTVQLVHRLDLPCSFVMWGVSSALLPHPADLAEQRLRRHGVTEKAAQQIRRLVCLSRAQQLFRQPRKPSLITRIEPTELRRDPLPDF